MPSLRSSCVLVPSSFCFYCSVAHRDLHSFPTRRSSDLVAIQPFEDRPDTLGLVAQDHDDRRQPGGEGPPRGAAGERLDRKSTRLNSSHRCISYAVFCLKKKNKKKKEAIHKAAARVHERD